MPLVRSLASHPGLLLAAHRASCCLTWWGMEPRFIRSAHAGGRESNGAGAPEATTAPGSEPGGMGPAAADLQVRSATTRCKYAFSPVAGVKDSLKSPAIADMQEHGAPVYVNLQIAQGEAFVVGGRHLLPQPQPQPGELVARR